MFGLGCFEVVILLALLGLVVLLRLLAVWRKRVPQEKPPEDDAGW